MNKSINRDKTVSLIGYDLGTILESSKELNIFSILIEDIREKVEDLYRRGFTTFLSCMTEGFEMIAADVVLQTKDQYPNIKLIAIIPYPGHEIDYNSPDKCRYKHIIDRADEKFTVSGGYHDGVHEKLTDFMLSNSSHLMCYCNGKPFHTEDVYLGALESNMAITNICRD